MSRNYLVDTHVWLWYAQGNRNRLPSPQADHLVELDRQGRLALSIMSVWELGLLAAKNRIRLGCAVREWLHTFLHRTRFRIIDCGIDVVLEANALPGPFHADPADRLIVATARHHDLTLVTEDRKILDYAAQGYLRACTTQDEALCP